MFTLAKIIYESITNSDNNFNSNLNSTPDSHSISKLKQAHDQFSETSDSDSFSEKDIFEDCTQDSNCSGLVDDDWCRKFLDGQIDFINNDVIVIKFKNKSVTVSLEDLVIDYEPDVGDLVAVCCFVEFVDDFFKITEVIRKIVSLRPSQKRIEVKCIVTAIDTNWGGVLNGGICYFRNNIVPPSVKCNLQAGDEVLVDMIASEWDDYSWRCIKLTSIIYANALGHCLMSKMPMKQQTLFNILGIDKWWVIPGVNEHIEIYIDMVSCSKQLLTVKSIELLGNRYGDMSQLQLIDPAPGESFVVQPGETRRIRMAALTKMSGERREIFNLVFQCFRVKRTLRFYTLDKNELWNNHEQIVIPYGSGRYGRQRMREYANEIWSCRQNSIPGVGMLPKRRFVARQIPDYEVPKQLRDVYLSISDRREMDVQLANLFPVLEEPLTMQNYAERFQTLLHLEEADIYVAFRRYDCERVRFTRDGEYLSLIIENVVERRPVLVIGDFVRAIHPLDRRDRKYCYDGIIHKVLKERVLLKFHPTFHEIYEDEEYRLEFYFSRFGLRKQHFSVIHIGERVGENFLFPQQVRLCTAPQIDVQLDAKYNMRLHDSPLTWFNPQLNHLQRVAVFNILRGETFNMPFIIFGPPGTGKTLTIIETVLQLIRCLPSCRILLGTPSNSAADMLALLLIRSGILQPDEFVRILSFNQIERHAFSAEIAPYSATVDIALDGTADNAMHVTSEGIQMHCQVKDLGRRRVIIGTAATLGNFLQMQFGEHHFTHVIVDEAGHCTEPETMSIILSLMKRRGRVILVGDPMQMSAVVNSYYAQKCQLALSFLERLLSTDPYRKNIEKFPTTSGYDPRLVTKLLYNYRALPSIVNIYNKLFYDNELIATIDAQHSKESRQLCKMRTALKDSLTEMDLSTTHGVFFYGVRGEHRRDQDSPSWFNQIEASEVVGITKLLYNTGAKAGDIGIISPYTRQVRRIFELFRSEKLNIPKMGSVEEFQGQERDIIIISTVRSSSVVAPNDVTQALGFIKCDKRINVAVSRARYMLIILGNPQLLCCDSTWRWIIKDCCDSKTYFGCRLSAKIFESFLDTEKEPESSESKIEYEFEWD